MSCEHVKGNPPPRMSSKEGIPVEVIKTDEDPGRNFVPEGFSTSFEDVFRLNDDILWASRVCGQ